MPSISCGEMRSFPGDWLFLLMTGEKPTFIRKICRHDLMICPMLAFYMQIKFLDNGFSKNRYLFSVSLAKKPTSPFQSTKFDINRLLLLAFSAAKKNPANRSQASSGIAPPRRDSFLDFVSWSVQNGRDRQDRIKFDFLSFF